MENEQRRKMALYAKAMVRAIHQTGSIDTLTIINSIDEHLKGEANRKNIEDIVTHGLPHLLKNQILFHNNKLTDIGIILATNPNASLDPSIQGE